MFKHSASGRLTEIYSTYIFLIATISQAPRFNESLSVGRGLSVLDQVEPIIRVTDLHKSYADIEVLRGISIAIAPKSVVSVIGASGSGKSTFLRCLNFLERPTSGTIAIDGESASIGQGPAPSARNIARLRAKLGMVFQQFNLWPHLSALENVMEALLRVRRLPRDEARRRANAMLETVGLSDKGDARPAKLSGGQQQRVAIARALAMEPHIMLFDEPTSALDPELVGEVLQVMKQLARDGMTMAVVTHEMGFAAQVADKVVFIDQGRIAVQGNPHAVFHDAQHPRLRQFLQNYLDRNAFWSRGADGEPA